MILAALVLGIPLTTTSALAQQDGQGEGQRQGQRQGQGGPRHGPPPQSFEACSEAEVGAACSFTGRNDAEVAGTCRDVRGKLACVPKNAPRGAAATRQQRHQQQKKKKMQQQQQQQQPQEQPPAE